MQIFISERGLILIIDFMFLAANATKIPYGGWFPLLVAVIIIILLTTWKAGRALLIRIEMANEVTLNELGPTLNLQCANEHVEKCGELRKCCAQKKSE